MRMCTSRRELDLGWCTMFVCYSVLQYKDVDIAKKTRFGWVHSVCVLQCVCCSVLQSFVVCCSVLQYKDVDIAKRTRFGLVHGVCVLQCVCCSVLQRVAVCSSMLQCVAV